MKNKSKVITICGSLRFMKEIMIHSERLELEGNCVLGIVYPTKEDKDAYTDKQFAMLGEMHRQKIDMSDAIFVVNVGNYIGSSTRSEIEYATKLNKEIIYLQKTK